MMKIKEFISICETVFHVVKRHRGLLFVILLVAGLTWAMEGTRPGHVGRGVVLLPNGWKIAPAGRHLTLGDLPLEMVESPDGQYLIVTNNGYSRPMLFVVDPHRFYVRERTSLENAWLGLAWSPDGKKLYSSAGGDAAVQVLSFQGGSLQAESTFGMPKPNEKSFVGGLAVSPDGTRLYVVQVLGNVLDQLDAGSGKLIREIALDAEPYTCLLTPDGKKLYVSLWGGSGILELDAKELRVLRAMHVGEHPNSMLLSPDAGRLFVACASTNTVWVIDLEKESALEQISVALYPHSPIGSTPTGMGLSPDGKTLLVANSDNNAVAMVDVSEPGKSRVKGFIPVGWYPTVARFSRDGKRIYVLNGKGLTSVPNPHGPSVPNFIGQLLLGSLSVIDVPTSSQLASYTKTVYDLTPYSDAIRLTPLHTPQRSPIPQRVGDPSPIKYVFYVIRENRTYDQVLGDMKEGNGDPNLCLVGEDVTPNAHALAREFVLLDNFYVDAEVSADGHAFSMGAYANDFIEKTWPMYYAARGGDFLTVGGGKMRNAYGNIAAPPYGYIWDAAKHAGIRVRSYGEFGAYTDDELKKGSTRANVPGLEGMIHPKYPPYDLDIPDNHRIDIWLQEFGKFEEEGNLPRLSIIQLGNDHTAGTRPGYSTPRAMIAENDVALGRLVEAISKGRFWNESAIFVLEDDAQNGPDHVDAHRSVALILSPYTRRGIVDSTMYTTTGLLRTMELILGLEPMSQYDAAATPAYNAFQEKSTLTPYIHREAIISLEERNAPTAPGAAQSMNMNLDEPDRAPMRELNEILWRSVKGKGSRMPPPVRAAFVVEREEE